ncbi:MAG: hypothetical protein LJE62_17260, partial [Silicimonas sp.]|nr:hypothetical protein [Silicimonas sp.]
MSMSEHGAKRQNFLGSMAFLKDAKARREAALIAPFLDAQFYLENNADVAAAGLDAGYHYAKYGWREGRDPSPSFSTSGYLSQHPRLALEGTNPLVHFAQGAGSRDSAAEPVADERLRDEIALISEHFDPAFYARRYRGATAGDMSAAEYYCRTGWREGHDPAPDFSTSYYLTTNPDIRESGVNPFWHYLIAGRDEGRLPIHPGGWRHGVLSRQTTFEAHCADWKRTDPEPDLLSREALAERLEAMREAQGMLISIGHDDYRKTPGGVQLCVEIEARDSLAHGLDYLNLHPWQPLPKLADADADSILCLVLNGRMVGTSRASNVAAALSSLPGLAGQTRLVIHHLSGHAPEAVASLAGQLGVERAHFWLHDYFTLCTSYALQRNNVTPCSVPDAASNACGICIFREERARQASRLARFFETLAIDVVSPSRVALEFWEARSDLPTASMCVHSHVELAPVPTG